MEKILVTEPKFYPQEILEDLKKYGTIEVAKNKKDMLNKIKSATVILGWVQDNFDKQMIDFAPNLKIIATASAGINHIDSEYAKSKGIRIVNVPGMNARAVAEFTLGLILSSMRKINHSFDHVKKGNWSPLGFVGQELTNKTLGLIGFGKIPKMLIQLAKGFEIKTIVYDPFLNAKDIAEFGVKPVSLEELLKNSDVISLHVPFTEENRNFIDAEKIEKMKDGVFLINTSRGEIVDESAIINYSKKGKIAGYACDVLCGEPPTDSLILKYLKEDSTNNIIVTSHIAHGTEESVKSCGSSIVNQIKEILENS